MQWEYKSITLESSENELDEKLNKFGKDNWEVFSLVKLPLDVDSLDFNDFGVIFSYDIAMKRPLTKIN